MTCGARTPTIPMSLAMSVAVSMCVGTGAAHAQAVPEQIASMAANGKLCVDVPGGMFQEGVPVRLFNCRRNDNQLFDYDVHSRLLRVHGLCLTVFAGPLTRAMQEKDQVALRGCDGGVTQRWTRARCDGEGRCVPATGSEPVHLSVGPLCLAAPADGKTGKDLTVERCTDTPPELWQFIAR